ncbi:RNA methyltransferase tRNA(m5U54)methyltransferase [Agyrium rufum]|nr:RNA methyltransferase tRNA(m5U54)methyltransferase [Agyrium rufum]
MAASTGDQDASEKSTRTVDYDGKTYSIVKEGLAEILNLKAAPRGANNADNSLTGPGAAKAKKPKHYGGGVEDAPDQSVFYNPIQQFNRDLSVLAIKTFAEDLVLIRKKRHERRLKNPVVRDAAPGATAFKGKKRKAAEEHGNGRPNPGIAGESDGGAAVPGATDVTGTADASTAASTEESGQAPEKNASQIPNGNAIEHTHSNGASAADAPASNVQAINDLVSLGHSYRPEAVQPNSTPQAQPIRVLDALSATGLRAIRYAKEIPLLTNIVANDLSPSATTSIALNFRHNDLPASKVRAITSDAILHMHTITGKNNGSEKYHVIDLDPYGTAAPFLDAAIQALVDGGLLCVTCTDAGIFASLGFLEKTFSQYGGLPMKGSQSHEAGLRLILHAIATSAAKYGIAIEPLLSLSIDFYARVFVRAKKSPAEVKFLAGKTMMVYSCGEGCGSWTTQYVGQTKPNNDKKGNTVYRYSQALAPSATQLCEHCDYKTHLVGPMWGGPLHNPFFVQKMIDGLEDLDEEVYGTMKRMEGMLMVARDETLLPEPESVESNGVAKEQDGSITDGVSTGENQSKQNEEEAALQSSNDERAAPPPQSQPIASIHPSLHDPTPFFLIPSTLARTLHCVSPSDAALRGALTHLGYQTTRSHTKPGSIRTDAPFDVIWEVMREWVRQRADVKEGVHTKGTAGAGVMRRDRSRLRENLFREDIEKALQIRGRSSDGKEELEGWKEGIEAALYRVSKRTGNDESAIDGKDAAVPKGTKQRLTALQKSKLEVIFDEKLGREKAGLEVGKKLVRYQMNPRKNWGPMTKARDSG